MGIYARLRKPPREAGAPWGNTSTGKLLGPLTHLNAASYLPMWSPETWSVCVSIHNST